MHNSKWALINFALNTTITTSIQKDHFYFLYLCLSDVLFFPVEPWCLELSCLDLSCLNLSFLVLSCLDLSCLDEPSERLFVPFCPLSPPFFFSFLVLFLLLLLLFCRWKIFKQKNCWSILQQFKTFQTMMFNFVSFVSFLFINYVMLSRNIYFLT